MQFLNFIFHISTFKLYVSYVNSRLLGFISHISDSEDFGIMSSNVILHISHSKFQISDFRIQISESHFGDLGLGEPLGTLGEPSRANYSTSPLRYCIRTLQVNLVREKSRFKSDRHGLQRISTFPARLLSFRSNQHSSQFAVNFASPKLILMNFNKFELILINDN